MSQIDPQAEYERQHAAHQAQLAEERALADRLNRATRLAKIAELDAFEETLQQIGDDAASVAMAERLSAEERAELPTIWGKLVSGTALEPAESYLLERAMSRSEKTGKALRRKLLRSIQAGDVKMLALIARSPSYPLSEKLKALKQLEEMRAADPGLSAAEIDELLGLPMAKAAERLVLLSLSGVISKEQADHVLRALEYRNEAHLRDLLTRFPEGRPPIQRDAETAELQQVEGRAEDANASHEPA